MQKRFKEEINSIGNLETPNGVELLAESNKNYLELKNDYPDLYKFIIDQVGKQKLKLNNFFQNNNEIFQLDNISFPDIIIRNQENNTGGSNFYHPDGTFGVSLNVQSYLELLEYNDEIETIKKLRWSIRRTIIHEYMHFALDKNINIYNNEKHLIFHKSGLNIHSAGQSARINGQEISFVEINEAITEFMTIFYLMFENSIDPIDKISNSTLNSIRLENNFYKTGYTDIVNKIIDTLQEINIDKRVEFVTNCVEAKRTNSIKPILSFLKVDGFDVNPIKLYRLNYKLKSEIEEALDTTLVDDETCDTTLVKDEEIAETLY